VNRIIDQFGPTVLDHEGKPAREIAQGYVRVMAVDERGRKVHDSLIKNTVVNDARRSAAAAFANMPGLVGLGFNVKQYRLGYSNALVNHWDGVNNKPVEAPFTLSTPLIQYPGYPVSPNQDYFHTQADVSGLLADGLHWVGAASPLANKAISLGVDYPFNSDEYAVRLYVELDATTSVGATFDTVEIILANGRKFAHRWTYPIEKMPGWALAVEHLVLF
jgi:hypothetical protein